MGNEGGYGRRGGHTVVAAEREAVVVIPVVVEAPVDFDVFHRCFVG